MSARARLALAALCALLALAAGIALLAANRRQEAFSTLVTPVPPPQNTPAQIHAPPRSGTGYRAGAVDVNTAREDELMTVSGIGPALAQAILTERDTNGIFYFPEDMLTVKGIGGKTLDKIAAQFRFPAGQSMP